MHSLCEKFHWFSRAKISVGPITNLRSGNELTLHFPFIPPPPSKFPSRYDRRTNPRKRPKRVHRLFRSLVRNTFSCPWQHAVFHRSQWMRSSRISSVFFTLSSLPCEFSVNFIICEMGVFLYYLFSDSWHKKVPFIRLIFGEQAQHSILM